MDILFCIEILFCIDIFFGLLSIWGIKNIWGGFFRVRWGGYPPFGVISVLFRVFRNFWISNGRKRFSFLFFSLDFFLFFTYNRISTTKKERNQNAKYQKSFWGLFLQPHLLSCESFEEYRILFLQSLHGEEWL